MKKLITKIIIMFAFYFAGFYLVWNFGNWKIALGIFLILIAVNIENSSKFISRD